MLAAHTRHVTPGSRSMGGAAAAAGSPRNNRERSSSRQLLSKQQSTAVPLLSQQSSRRHSMLTMCSIKRSKARRTQRTLLTRCSSFVSGVGRLVLTNYKNKLIASRTTLTCLVCAGIHHTCILLALHDHITWQLLQGLLVTARGSTGSAGTASDGARGTAVLLSCQQLLSLMRPSTAKTA
jgi:hypothetical protein